MGSIGPGITTVLTMYRRPYTLVEQIEAVRRQSVPSSEVWLWVNASPENSGLALADLSLDRRCINDHNWKFYGRFALALLASTEYVAIFDDDAIPGRRWFENCLAVMERQPGIMGTGGVRFPNREYDHEEHKYGWVQPSDQVVEVDFVGQAWFLRREWLCHLWREEPATWDNGEDMHLSYSARKYGGVRSFCPPHPKDGSELHGSTRGAVYDADERATSLSDDAFWSQREFCMKEYVSRGWLTGEMGGDEG